MVRVGRIELTVSRFKRPLRYHFATLANCPKIYLVQAFALHNQFPSPIFDQREDKSEQEVATLMLLTLGLRHLARGGLITHQLSPIIQNKSLYNNDFLLLFAQYVYLFGKLLL